MTIFGRIFAAPLLILSALGLHWAAPAAASPKSPSASSSQLVLEDFFRGTLTAEGTFTSTLDGSVRGMKVKMRGRWDPKTATLTLVEDFEFSDGEKDRKTWRFTRTGEDRYVGTREDVVGKAEIRQVGDAVTLVYKAVVRTKSGSAFTVTFDDLLVKTDARTVRNTATVKWLFFTVGEVDLTIRRVR